jgi:3',5'-cyclic AMP phosphodiesterase CpdA
MNNIKSKVIFIFFLLVICLYQTNISYGTGLNDFTNPFIKKNQIFKVVQVTDVHFQEIGDTTGKRQIGNSKPILDEVISEINNIKNVDTVLFTGDMINKPDERELYKFLKELLPLKAVWFAVIGNHDIAVKGQLTKQKYMDILHCANSRIPAKSYYIAFPKPNWAIIALDGVKDNLITANGEFDKEELKWLDNQLSLNKDKHILIFEHFPVIEPYKSSTHKVLNDIDYLNILNKHKNVIAVIAGHYHAAKADKVNNIAFIDTSSLIQFPNAYRVLEFEEFPDKMVITTEIKQVNYKTVIPLNIENCKDNAKNCGLLNDRNTKIEISK